MWTTRTFKHKKTYIVIKHKLSDINGMIMGVKFRNGWGVVEKDSKQHVGLKKLPFLKDAPEYPLEILSEQKFCTRYADINTIYGRDVYEAFVLAMNPIQQEEIKKEEDRLETLHKEDSHKCAFRKANGDLCERYAFKHSPGGFCDFHIMNDPFVEKLKLHIPKRMSHEERLEIIHKIKDEMKKAAKASE